MSPLRVGLVSPYDLSVPGGVQAQVLGLAAYLRSWGDDVVVIGPGLPEGIAGVDLGESLSIPGNGSMVPIAADPRSRRRIRSAAAGLDLLHVHEPLMPLASLLATHAGPPVVGTFHAAPGRAGRLAYRLTRPLLSRLLGNTAMVTAVSRAAASVLPDGLEVRLIPNGLDVESMKVETTRVPGRVAFLGRDEPRKGLDVLLEAWETVRTARPEAELVVMGSKRDDAGPTWMGRVDEGTKAMVLSSSSIYVAPQTGGESFGIVLLEAMAAGAAVVASDLESFRDWAGEAALLVP
ncbi:MAG TPA: glycosyltransferase family 4 protein, partial [Acidimicrobiia bacterium]|nr:glycosyltransferase family 4 protein [Acidimicrobiia bacterium]